MTNKTGLDCHRVASHSSYRILDEFDNLLPRPRAATATCMQRRQSIVYMLSSFRGSLGMAAAVLVPGVWLPLRPCLQTA